MTSSAVVGSSAISSRGSHASASADQHALALAARELVRVVARAPRRQPDELEQLARRARDTAPPRASGACSSDRLADLAPDALDGVERVQRALEDDRELGPAHRAQAPGPHRQHVLAVEQDRARDLGPARQQPQQRAGERRLAAARLAGQAERLARRRGRSRRRARRGWRRARVP